VGKTWSPAPGEPVVLRLDPHRDGLTVRIVARGVSGARESRFRRFVYAPRLWAPTLAALAVFALVSSAFATGTLRPAPPPASAPLPGEPTPTPDTRPAISMGGFVLLPPVLPTPLPPTPIPTETPARTLAEPQIPTTPDEQVEPSPEPPPPPACTNPFGIGCSGAAPPPPASKPVARRQVLPPRPTAQPPVVQPAEQATPMEDEPASAAPAAPAEEQLPPPCTNLFGIGCPPSNPPMNSVIPAPSPAAVDSSPPRGSHLEMALQVARAADENFAREVDPGARSAPPRQP
jgi:hypothetical protein